MGEQNWINGSNGSHVQKSGQSSSWPMLKIDTETIFRDQYE